MLSSLRIKNFRALQDLHVPRLGRVNLIVGKNNAGKSTILEALRVYAGQAHPALLRELLVQHDESEKSSVHTTPEPGEEPPYRAFFPDRRLPDGDEVIYIGDVEERDFVRVAHTLYTVDTTLGVNGEIIHQQRIPLSPRSAVVDQGDVSSDLLVTSSRRSSARWLSRLSPRAYIGPADPTDLPVGYVPPGVLPKSKLAEHWDAVALTDYDQLVCDGLRIIDPSVKGLAFVQRKDETRTPIVKLAGAERPVPLSSMGDGMTRVLQLLLLLAPARGGLYLVDEFENGLHYSVQERVWEMIFTLANAHDMQVFAATHSWDCIDAFRQVAARRRDSAVLFRVGRSARSSDHGKIIATVFDGEALATLSQLDVEVR